MIDMKTTLSTETADNSEITITESANDNESIYVNSLSCSFSGNVSGMRLSIEADGTEVWGIDIPDANIHQFDWSVPIKLQEGSDLTARLTASGTGGTTGTLNIAYSKGE